VAYEIEKPANKRSYSPPRDGKTSQLFYIMNEAMEEQILAVNCFNKLSSNEDASISSGKAVLRFDIRIMCQVVKALGIMIAGNNINDIKLVLEQTVLLRAMEAVTENFMFAHSPSFLKDFLDIMDVITLVTDLNDLQIDILINIIKGLYEAELTLI
jgi:hypothetical protein